MTAPKRLLLFVIALSLLTDSLAVSRIGAEGQKKRAVTAERRALEYDVREFGAKGDGQTLDTAAINQAIEQLVGRIFRCLMVCGRGVDNTALVGNLAYQILHLLRLQQGRDLIDCHTTTHG
jgi:hypothetical protein